MGTRVPRAPQGTWHITSPQVGRSLWLWSPACWTATWAKTALQIETGRLTLNETSVACYRRSTGRCLCRGAVWVPRVEM